jgi:hypothetical protein
MPFDMCTNIFNLMNSGCRSDPDLLSRTFERLEMEYVRTHMSLNHIVIYI